MKHNEPCTVAQLISLLNNLDEDLKVYFDVTDVDEDDAIIPKKDLLNIEEDDDKVILTLTDSGN